jgi:hypothetical protein
MKIMLAGNIHRTPVMNRKESFFRIFFPLRKAPATLDVRRKKICRKMFSVYRVAFEPIVMHFVAFFWTPRVNLNILGISGKLKCRRFNKVYLTNVQKRFRVFHTSAKSR